MGATIDEIIDSLKRGQGKRVSDLVKMALEEGTNPQTILEEGFLSGMEQVAEKFRKEEVGVPEILSVTRALDRGVSCQIVDAHNRIRMVDGQIMLQKSDQFGKFVSLIPFTPEVTGITLKGFAYEVENFTLVSGIARGVSNELEAETASITCENGILLVIESRD